MPGLCTAGSNGKRRRKGKAAEAARKKAEAAQLVEAVAKKLRCQLSYDATGDWPCCTARWASRQWQQTRLAWPITHVPLSKV